MSKKVFLVVLIIILASCAPMQEIVDNGNPGLIMVVTFLDENNNGIYEKNEPAISDKVGISQDVSCPPGNMDLATKAETNIDGEAVFEDLEPGVYCVMYLGSRGSTTKLTLEIELSSEQQIRMELGLTE